MKLKTLLASTVALLCSVGAWGQTDVTSYIISNPSFETGTTIGWTVGSSKDTGARSTGRGTYEMSSTVGSYLFNTWSQGIPIKQTLGTLPAGSYTLSAIVGSDGATMYMIVNDNHSSYVTTSDAKEGKTLSHSFTLDAPTEVTIGVVGGAADGSYLEEGHWWYKCDNFTLTYTGDATTADFLAVKKAQLAKTTHSTALLDAITSAENANAAATAILAAEKSAYDYKTISTSDVFEYGATYNFWNKSTTNGEVAYNTWSTEVDGSEMTTPFVQNWVANGTQLTGNSAAGTFYYTLNLNEGDKVKVSALVRVFNEATPTPTGASFFVGDSEVDIISEGSACTGDYSAKGIYGTFTATGIVGAEGTLDFGVRLDQTSNVNWIAMKNVTAEILPTITLDQTDVSLVNGETVTLTATVTPSYANDRSYTWSSSDETVATVSNGVVTTHKAGTATIKATSNTDESIVASATIRVTNPVDAPSSYSTLGAGDFYIMNAATGTFLGGANYWGTQASVIEHGIPFTVAIGDGVYTLDSHTYNDASHHYFNGTYIDGVSTNLYITSLGSGRYSISTASSSSYLSANAANTGASDFASNANSKYAQWYFLSKSDLEAAFSNATPESPVDATFYIGDQNFSRNHILSEYTHKKTTNPGSETYPWTITAENFNLKGGEAGGGNGKGNFCAESYQKTFTLSQVMTVANGRYKLRAQAMERKDGSDPVSAVIYASNGTDEETVSFKEIEGNEDSMTDCSNQFTAGKYYTDWITIDVTNGTLTVGAKSTSSANWCVWDNFELYYCAPLADSDDYAVLNSAISTAEAKTLGFEDGEYAPYNNLAALTALAAAKSINQGINNTKESVNNATTTLTDATWTDNDGEVNAIYDGSFKADYTSVSGNNDGQKQAIGWYREGESYTTDGYNVRYMELPDALASGTTHGLFTKFSFNYGGETGYTLPLKGNTVYELTFKHCGWGHTPYTFITVIDPNSSTCTITPAYFHPSASDGDTSVENYTTYTGIFKTSSAGNYVLSFAKYEDENKGTSQGGNQRQIIMTDISLVKATATLSEEATSALSTSGLYKSVTLTRTLKGGQWNGFSLPFSLSSSQLAASDLNGASIKKWASVDENEITLEDATEIVAGDPYLVKPESNIVNPTFDDVNVTNPSEAVKGTGDYTFQAHLYNTSLAIDGSVAYVSTTDSSIKKLTSGGIKGLRAIFNIPTGGSVKALTVNFGDDTTGILTVDTEGNITESGAIYNLAGQRLSKAQKGVNIINGKKVIVK